MTAPVPPLPPSNSKTAPVGRSSSARGSAEPHLWMSDREIGTGRQRPDLEYSASDYRSELERVERKRLRAVVVALAVLIVVVFLAAGALFRA